MPGNSVDRDRHVGFHEVMEKEAPGLEIVQVVGNWDDGTAQKATADALAVHGKFVGLFTQGGSTGSVRAFLDAGHPMVPMAGEGENGFRKYIAAVQGQGPEGPVLRSVAGSGGDLDQGRIGGARGQPDAAADLGADPVRGLHDARGWQELLVRSHGQLLHAQ